ncbi:DNA-directed RNA polymerase subunit beta [Halobacillus litoralis]|uniref:DNA-directed RNA polymerase subunit beta n=1 Tax=Halobacillus litoralis TaxID=45668 RepID=UPI001CFD243E|nr:DNA-directed RNA polymerase subunit beta [Halobacillus litoralis]
MATDPKSKGKKLNKEQEGKAKGNTREKQKSVNNDKSSKKPERKENVSKKGRRRILPIWLRIILVLLFSAIALLIGLMVGYGVLGDGNPTDALNLDTWKHIWNIVTKTES